VNHGGFKKVGRRVFIAVSLLTLLGLLTPKFVPVLGQEEGETSINGAEKAVSSAFEVVLDAEYAGVNVSKLIARLNEAASLLAESNVLLRNGNLSGALRLAGHAVDIADEVEVEASSLRDAEIARRELAFKISLVSATVGIPTYAFLMFFSWRWFKGFYLRRILGMKPEVTSDVED